MAVTTKDVTDFISGFLNVQNSDAILDVFMNGRCFWFSQILNQLFDGQTYYNPVDNHFVSMIYVEDRSGVVAFDITGERNVRICGIHNFDGGRSAYYWWPDYMDFDPLDAERVIRDCIEFKGGE